MKIVVKSGKRIFVNGAVIKFENKTSLKFLNNVRFLIEQHVIQPEDANTALKRLYYSIQLMIIQFPISEKEIREYYMAMRVARADYGHSCIQYFDQIDLYVSSGRYHEAMKYLRVMMRDMCTGSESFLKIEEAAR